MARGRPEAAAEGSAAIEDKRDRVRDREKTERSLLAAARELIMREGVLAGLNLSDVADLAGVNRGLIYQYFGSRQELLRAAIAETQRELRAHLHEAKAFSELDFPERRLRVLELILPHVDMLKLEVLSMIDGDEELRLFPAIEDSLKLLERDVERGIFEQGDDLLMMHVVSSVAMQGYCLFRDQISNELGIEGDELDVRVKKVLHRLFAGLGDRRV